MRQGKRTIVTMQSLGCAWRTGQIVGLLRQTVENDLMLLSRLTRADRAKCRQMDTYERGVFSAYDESEGMRYAYLIGEEI